MTESASSIFPAADIFVYYESNAYWSLSDRGFIIEKGFQEWLLAGVIIYTDKPAATEYPTIRKPHIKPPPTDLIVLIANLIGGVL